MLIRSFRSMLPSFQAFSAAVLVACGFWLILLPLNAGAEQAGFLSVEERQWISEHGDMIRLAPDPHYPPMEFFDDRGEYRGIAADFLALIEEKAGLRIQVLRVDDFAQVLQKARARDIDLVATVIERPERLEYLLFTEPYISIPNVIVTRDEIRRPLTVSDLQEISFVYQAGYAIGDILAERDGITHGRAIVDPGQALKDLSLGRIEAMVGNLAVISYYVRRLNITNLRVAGDCGYADRISFACRSDWPILASIIDKTLAEITPEERDRIINAWIELKMPPFFHELFEQHGAIMLLIDPETGGIVDANRAAAQFYGYSRNRLRTMHIQEINTLSPDEVEQEFRAAAREDRNFFIFPHRLADGEIRTVEAYSWPVTMDDRKYLFSIVHDVTPRIAAEEALQREARRFIRGLGLGMAFLALLSMLLVFLLRSQRRTVAQREAALQALGSSERRLSTLMGNLPGMAYRCTVDRNWTMLFVSQGCRDLTGYDPAGLVDNRVKAYGDIIHPEDRDYVWTATNRGVEEQRPFTLEYRIIDAAGSERWVWERGVAVRGEGGNAVVLEGFVSDISDRKRAEEEQERYRAFIENVEDACFELDLPGRLTFYNEAFLTLGGFTAEEQLAMHYRDRHPTADEAERVYSIYNNVYRTGIPATGVEYQFVKKDGSVGILEVSISLIRDGKGTVTGFRGVGREVTERKRLEVQREEALAEIHRLNEELEERVRRRTAELEASNRELEAFAYSVSHDLRAPLRAIDGFSQALEEDCGDRIGEAGSEYLERIRAGARRMARLIDDLLDLSRITRTEMRYGPVDMSALAHEIIEELRHGQPERSVEALITSGMVVQGDKRLLRLMLHNLLENAWKFTGNNHQARIEFGVAHVEGAKTWYVRDNGVGFDMAYVDKIFGAFQRLHRSDEFPGTGIGLAIVHRVVQQHGGVIRAESTTGEGTTFFFRF